MESWGSLALREGLVSALPRAERPSWHYMHSDQWRYEKSFRDYHTVPQDQPENTLADGHTADINVRAVRNGWLPFYPQWDRNPLDVVKEADKGRRHDQRLRSRITSWRQPEIQGPELSPSRSPTRATAGRGSGSSGAATP